MPFSETAGYVGMVLLLSAYGLMSKRKLSSDGVPYHGMNAVGAALVGVSVWTKEAWAAFGLEAAWCLIGLAGLFAAMKTRRRPVV